MVYKTPKEVQERKDEKKRHIIECALKVFAERGYHGTTVKDIVDEAKVSVGSFYFYFRNKEDLFETLYDEMARMLFNTLHCSINAIEYGVVSSFVRGITNFLLAVQMNRELTRIMMIEAVGLNPRFEQKRAEATKMFINNATQHFEDFKNNGLSSVLDVNVFAEAFIGTVYNVIITWLQKEDDVVLTDSAYALIVYNLQALKLEFVEEEIKTEIEEILKRGCESLIGGECKCFKE